MDLNNKSVLIIKPSSMGDIIHSLPLVHALKRHYPSCHVGWVVQKSLVSLLEADPNIDRIFPIDIPSTSEPSATVRTYVSALSKTVTCLKWLRSKFVDNPYDLVLDLHASFRSGLIGSMNPGGVRLGFAEAKELNTFFQSKVIHCAPNTLHAVDKNLNFAKYLQINVEAIDFQLFLGRDAEVEASSFLEQSGASHKNRLVYANPATRWATKFWNERAWAELADKLVLELNSIVIFGGASAELHYVNRIVSLMSQKPIVGAGRLSPIGAAALIGASDVYVGVDSGPMHIAALLGKPVVAIFGPTDPAKVGPYGRGHSIIRVESLSCLGCRKSVCNDKRCMNGISAERVFEEIKRLMNWT
ncbi:MAG: glycosyltransferase family 9 protein [Desulfomonilaceae bacterium]